MEERKEEEVRLRNEMSNRLINNKVHIAPSTLGIGRETTIKIIVLILIKIIMHNLVHITIESLCPVNTAIVSNSSKN